MKRLLQLALNGSDARLMTGWESAARAALSPEGQPMESEPERLKAVLEEARSTFLEIVNLAHAQPADAIFVRVAEAGMDAIDAALSPKEPTNGE